MKAQIINGTQIAKELRAEVIIKSNALRTKHSIKPSLTVVIVGEEAASTIYVRNKSRLARECGIESSIISLPIETSEKDLLAKLAELNADNTVHGILVQLPLPSHISKANIINAILPEKDVDGFHPLNVGLLFTDQVEYNKTLIPCTPKGSLMLIKKVLSSDISGKKAVVIGSSNIVGRPMAALLLNERCTVSIAHSKTKDLKSELHGAEIVVIGTGVVNLLHGDLIPNGAVIIDVGINRVLDSNGNGKIVGDVNFDDATRVASFLTPVPGGVGPMTIACLLQNAVIAACNQNNLEYSKL